MRHWPFSICKRTNEPNQYKVPKRPKDRPAYLILVRIVQKHALRHEVGDHGVAPQGRYVCPDDGQHFRDERLHEPAETAVLAADKNNRFPVN